MMLKVAKLGIAIAATLAWIVPAAYAGVPDIAQSFYVPQAGNTTTPLEGASTPRSFSFYRACPNNDGGTSFTNNARIKVVVRDVNGNGIAGIAAADICLLFNGGTPAQGFSGVGADSMIANSQFNQTPLCPDVRCVQADAETDATGTTFITFTGSSAVPGVGLRNPLRKWGHYDTEIPVYVLGFKISGRLTTASANGTYTLVLKSYDHALGTGTALNQGEAVTSVDFNGVVSSLTTVSAFSYWRDFDSSGAVISTDFNALVPHIGHDCDSPNNP
jgi:hypothetical protein